MTQSVITFIFHILLVSKSDTHGRIDSNQNAPSTIVGVILIRKSGFCPIDCVQRSIFLNVFYVSVGLSFNKNKKINVY